MAMVSFQPRPMTFSSPSFSANGPASFGEAAIASSASPAHSDHRSLEEHRERALREFKRIWNLCAQPQ